MRRFIEELRRRGRHATVPLLLPGLLCVVAAVLGQALNVAGVNVPVLAGWARWVVGVLGAFLVTLSLFVGVPPPPPRGERGALPTLPPNHVVRPKLLARLREALLDRAGAGPRQLGVWGMGGSGKSVLVAALLRDRAVRRRFPDGLAWVRLEPPTGDDAARQAARTQAQTALVAKLAPAGQTGGEITDVEQGRTRLADLLRNRASLVVIDNVWTAEDLYAFSGVLGRRGALVLTTRDVGLVRGIGAGEVEVAELSDAQARALAAGWAGVAEDSLPPEATETLREVHNLALGVATVAARVQAGQGWVELTERLRAADLAAIKSRFPGYPYPSLLAALQLGLDFLDPSDRQRYQELAVFAGRGAVPRSAVEALWAPAPANRSAADVGGLLARFGERALLRREPVTGRIDRIDLHDLQFDVARANLGDDLPKTHRQLQKGYALRCPHGWPSGPDDGYFYQHLAEHLAAAGRRDELIELLTDMRWMRSRLRAGGVTGLLTDYTVIQDEPELAPVQATIQLSAHVLALDPDQLPAQLAGRTIGRPEPALARLHAAATSWSESAWLCPIRPTLAQPGEALQQILTHPGWVHAVALSADGRTAISAGRDGTVRVWDLTATAAPRTLGSHPGGVRAVALSADGRTAISGGRFDGTVRVWVWDLTATAAPRELHHPRLVGAVALSPDGRTAITGGDDGTVRVWDLTGTAVPRELHHPRLVGAVALSPDGRTAVTVGRFDGTVRVWDLTATAAPRELHHPRVVGAMALSPDGRTAVTVGGPDGTVRVWDLTDGREKARWIADEAITAVALGDTVIVAGGRGGQVHALKLHTPGDASRPRRA